MVLTRKVRKNGNGHVVGVPVEVMNELRVTNGAEIEYVKQDDNSYVIKKVGNESREKEIINLTNEVFEQYDKTMKALIER